MPEVARLKELKVALKAAMDAEGGGEAWKVNKDAMETTLLRRMFVVPSFEIYGSVAGLYDFGPPGTAFKDRLLALWKRHFVYEEGMLEMECTTLTPYPVLETSGHVERFADLMVKDTTNGECFRADKLLEDHIEVSTRGGEGGRGPSVGAPWAPARWRDEPAAARGGVRWREGNGPVTSDGRFAR